jgi:phage terminase small subunit
MAKDQNDKAAKAGNGEQALLTPKQENFCLAYIETGNASEAYRRSYDASGMSDTSINRKAKELLDNGKIAARLAALRAPVVQKAQITLEKHLNDLKRLRDMAEASEKYGPAIQAEIARGKASGLYVEKTELTGPEGGPISIIQRVIVDPKR